MTATFARGPSASLAQGKLRPPLRGSIPFPGKLSVSNGMRHRSLQNPCTRDVFLAPLHKRAQDVTQDLPFSVSSYA